ncbi:MAG: NAD-dependent epimerase/dehydratase family protein [Candidatus Poseidoniales archaeon]|nr:NAD-dependent epimerase/dehydratase family protein [Candidatus Poseidoniales archaeon]
MVGPVLVTGAAGFIGSHVVRELLSQGRSVRATVRNPVNAEFLKQLPGAENLEIVQMDLLDRGTVDAAVVGCDDVIHCAAALYVGVKDAQKDVVDPSIQGTQNLLDAIDAAGGISRLIHTSSVAAVRRNGTKDGQTFSNTDWCDNATVDSNAYGLAKAGAERLARDWVASKNEAERPRYVSINPSIVFGPVMSKRHLKGSMTILDHLLKRKPPVLLKMHMNIVDVRDVATAHVRAMTEGADGGRYIVFNASMWMPQVNAVLRKQIPDRKWPRIVLPKSLSYVLSIFHPQLTMSWVKHNIGTSCEYDSSPANQDLGMEWIPIEDSIVDGARSAIEAGWR